MNIVLLSGGSGKRLWPLSNDTQSKQFLTLLSDTNNKTVSMVQRVFRQINTVIPSVNIIISTNETQLGIINRQLGDVPCVLEPSRRDTFPAIVLAASYLYYELGCSKEDTFISAPIDMYADDSFFAAYNEVEALTKDYSLALLGVLPTYNSEKYGYIVPEKSTSKVSKVRAFVEKPTEQVAQELIRKGALWNCGVFGCKIGYVLDKALEYIDGYSYKDYQNNYSQLPKTSFDYAVAELEPNIGVVVYEGEWKDLGTWNTLTEELDSSSIGNGIVMDNTCQNTHILNMLNTPIIGTGLKNIVAVASHDGILIADKTQSSYMKPLVDSINKRPCYEKRDWGTYRVLDYENSEFNDSSRQSYLVKHISMEAGKSFSLQLHNQRSEVWVVTSGTGKAIVGDNEYSVSVGSVLDIPVNTKHKLTAITNIELIETQLGPSSLTEEDIIRLDV